MTTLALPTRTSFPARVRAAAALALPLGLMNTLGGIIFFELSWATPIALFAIAMGALAVTAAVWTLRAVADGPRLLRLAMFCEFGFVALKLAVWQEGAAIPFGLVALAIAALLRERG